MENTEKQNYHGAYTNPQAFIQSADLIGAFSGYIRRPLPSLSGMVAQIFGPNGEESDSILALSLTKYLDAEVFVTIYQIKDSNGVLKKQNDNYPKIAQFLGIIRRAAASRGGMTAQFFAANGKDADAVTELGKSQYFDSLVFVEVRGKFAALSANDYVAPTKTIDQDFANKVTQYELKEYKKSEKKFKKFNDILSLSGFYRKKEVIYALAKEKDYINWLCANSCCWASNPTCNHTPVIPFELKNIAGPFNYLAFCQEHLDMIKDNYNTMINNDTYFEIKHNLKLQEFTQQELRNKFALSNNLEADSYKIYQWTKDNNLTKYLPSAWKKLGE